MLVFARMEVANTVVVYGGFTWSSMQLAVIN